MGTRSITRFKHADGEVFCAFYRHSDGYLEGHGKDLREWGSNKTLVNGLGGKDGKVWNGMGCAAADCVAAMKTEPGGIYLVAPRAEKHAYNYTIYPDPDWTWDAFERNGGQLHVTVELYSGEILYEGPLSKLPETDPRDEDEDEV